ncbi:NAD(P)H-flavin reductase [Flocculibacter collagenilyticus]|uniref:NAD(P)H-flavin reductase n=1 Tax=Flocculibacter collagenilyticus TaxID=2744479 RepID=UPI0018F340B4|nr:NAD(P)H-flavin reductase [Flocculibacter collagenilyticus]
MQLVDCQITHRDKLTEQIYLFRLTPSTPVQFDAGQYLQVVMGENDKRPFSIASSPSKPYLELHIGATESDSYAMQVVERLKQQDTVQVEVGLGHSQLNVKSPNPIILLAGGTGFSYVKSIADFLAEQNEKRPVFFYWGAKNEEALYAMEEMKQWQTHHTGYQFIPVIEEADETWQGKTGYVHQAVMEDIVSLEPYDIYIAGPFKMVGIVRDDFLHHGALLENMHADAFAFI